MKVLRAVWNYNPDLVNALIDERLLPEDPAETSFIGEDDASIRFELFEGRDNYFIRILPYEGGEEVIVPKSVDRKTAMNIAIYLVGKEYCKNYEDSCINDYSASKWLCESDYNRCLEDSVTTIDECKEELEECMREVEEELESCMREVDENYCRPSSEADRNLRKKGLRPLGCVSGIEEGSEDIDEVCYFLRS